MKQLYRLFNKNMTRRLANVHGFIQDLLNADNNATLRPVRVLARVETKAHFLN